MNYHGYVGTYSKGPQGGIFRIAVEGDKVSVTGNYEAENPSHLSRYGDFLLAVSETQSYEGRNGGSALSFRIEREGSLRKLSQRAVFGKDPCYIKGLGDQVFTANYSEGTASVFRFEEGILSESLCILPHWGKGVDPQRQEMAHIHCVEPTPDGNLAVCDLGTDEVVLYTADCRRLSSVSLPAGSGPRHILFHGKFAYVVTELTSRVFVFRYEGGTLSYQADLPLLSETFTGFSNAAAIKISPCGRWLSCSNRGHNSLTTFRIREDGGLAFLCNTPCGGDFPRDFAYTPDGKCILCANQYSDRISVLRVGEDGRTSLTEESCRIPAPVYILFD